MVTRIENNESIELTETNRLLEEYQKQDKAEAKNFLTVVESCLLELNKAEKTQVNFKELLYSELTHWIKVCCKNLSSEIQPMLKLCRRLAKKTLLNMDKLERILESLSNAIDSILDPKKIGINWSTDQAIFEILSTLAFSCKFMKDSSKLNRFEFIIDKIIIELCKNVILQNSLDCSIIFIEFFTKLLIKNKENYFPEVMLKKKGFSVIYEFLLSVIKKMHELNEPEIKKVFMMINEIFSIFIMKSRGDFAKLRLKKISSIILKSRFSEKNSFIVDIIEKSLGTINQYNPETYSAIQEVSKILMIPEIEDFSYKKFVNYLKSFNLASRTIDQSFGNELKRIVLSSSNLNNRIAMLDIIYEFFQNDFSVTELKLGLRFCTKHPELMEKILNLILYSSQKLSEPSKYIKLHPSKGYKQQMNINLSATKELCIWGKFFLDANIKQVLFRISFHTNIVLVCYTEKTKIWMEIEQQYQTQIFKEKLIKENDWNFILINFDLKQKVSSKYEVHLNINTRIRRVYCEKLHVLEGLCDIEFLFEGKVEYFKIFSLMFSLHDLKKINFHSSNMNISLPKICKYFNSSIFTLSPNDLHTDNNYKVPEVNIIKRSGIFESFATIGSLNSLLPILKLSEQSNDFLIFFQIISKFIQHSTYRLVIEDDFFPLLRILIIEKSHLVNDNWLEICSEILAASENLKIYSKVFKNLFLCSTVWSRLSSEFFKFYIEIIRINILKQGNLTNIEEITNICAFFLELIRLIDTENKELISQYFLNILSDIFSSNEKEFDMDLIIYLFAFLYCDFEVMNFSQGFDIFVNSLYEKKWKIANPEGFLKLFDIYGSADNEQLYSIQSTILKFSLWIIKKNIKLFESATIVNSIVIKLKDFIKARQNLIFFEVIIDFLIDGKILRSTLNEIFLCIIDALSLANEGNLQAFSNCLYENTKKNHDFCFIISKQDSFPGWTFQFINNIEENSQEFINNPLIKLAFFIFSRFENFLNFNKLRIFLQNLFKLNRFEQIFITLYEIISSNQAEISIKRSKKYLIEYFNVLEDIISRLEYEKISKEIFYNITIYLKTMIGMNFTLNFPKIPGFIGYNFLLKDSGLENDNFILLRDGGICRQMLKFIFISLSFKPDKHLGNLLKNFLGGKNFSEGELIEWKEVENETNVKKISYVGINKNKCNNLLPIYIFTEWIEIIKTYKYRGFQDEEIIESSDLLLEYIKKEKIVDCLKAEIKNCTDKQNIREYQQIKNDNLERLIPVYSKESFKKISNARRNIYNSGKLNDFFQVEITEKHKTEQKRMQEFTNLLKKCNTGSELFEFLYNQKDIEVELFLLALTSLKMTKLSIKYFLPDIKYQYFDNHIIEKPSFTSNSDKKTKQTPTLDVNERKIKKTFNNLIKNNKRLCGIHKEEAGDYYLKSNADDIGRKLMTKKKKNEEFAEVKAKDSLFQSSYLEQSDVQIDMSTIDQIEECVEISVDYSYDENLTILDEYRAESELGYEFLDVAPTEFECEIIKTTGFIYGNLHIADDCLIFTSKTNEKPYKNVIENIDNKKIIISNSIADTQILKGTNKLWQAKDIKEIITRRYIHVHSSIEIFFFSGKSVFINFFTHEAQKMVYCKLKKFQEFGVQFLRILDLNKYMYQWKIGILSNFEYLLLLNKYSGRSFNDITQYPIFPWILKDYSSSKLDLNNEHCFRDLKYPVCAQTKESQLRAKKKFNITVNDEIYPYNYGSHYSTSGIVLHYLLRIQPFSSESKKLQGGSYDLPDRLFSSIKKAWRTTQNHTSDVKELIPEFFYFPEMFLNINKNYFGRRQNNKTVEGVKLPRWAKNSVYYFINKHRKALESPYVSKHINHWFDLIFGFKQQLPYAEKNMNLFYPITYENKYIEMLEKAKECDYEALCCQAVHFGQTPIQVFKNPHLKRDEIHYKGSIPQRILEKYRYECIKKFNLPDPFYVLSTRMLLLILSFSDTCRLFKYKWTPEGMIDTSSLREVELAGIRTSFELKAVIFQEEFLVTAGHLDLAIYIHNFKGELCRVLAFHSMRITCLVGGGVIASASQDSSLVVWNEKSKKVLQGHLLSIYYLAIMCDHGLIISGSNIILIHDYRTAEILKKIDETCQGLFASDSGFFSAILRDEIRIFYINGKLVKSIMKKSNKYCYMIHDYLLIEESSCIRLIDLYEMEESEIILQEDLEIHQIHYNSAIDCLLLVNINQKYSLISIEAGFSEKVISWN